MSARVEGSVERGEGLPDGEGACSRLKRQRNSFIPAGGGLHTGDLARGVGRDLAEVRPEETGAMAGGIHQVHVLPARLQRWVFALRVDRCKESAFKSSGDKYIDEGEFAEVLKMYGHSDNASIKAFRKLCVVRPLLHLPINANMHRMRTANRRAKCRTATLYACGRSTSRQLTQKHPATTCSASWLEPPQYHTFTSTLQTLHCFANVLHAA